MLKYLFKTEYVDGTTFKQTKEDTSLVDPKRNAFYDVLNNPTRVKTFTLERYLERYSINLITGNFKINGVEIVPEPIVDKQGNAQVVLNRKLIWYMSVKRILDATYSTINGSIMKIKEVPEDRTYYFGWETTIKGKNYKRVIGIK